MTEINKRSNGENRREIGFLALIITHNTHATARDALLATVTRLQPAVGRPRGIAFYYLRASS
jgi:hypothetical protein